MSETDQIADLPTAKRSKLENEEKFIKINHAYKCKNFLKGCKSVINKEKSEHTDELLGGGIFNEPYQHMILPKIFMSDDDDKTGDNRYLPVALLKQVEEELMSERYIHKYNDLFNFYQTSDLKNCEKEGVKKLCNYLYTDVLQWASDLFDIQLDKSNMDLFGAQYRHQSTLLCHDDQLEGRAIAYILYLVSDDWEEKDGGELDLYMCDDTCTPLKIVKTMVPERNSMVLFRVSDTSYHQVAEVLSKNKIRLSIGGWFHHLPNTAEYLETQQRIRNETKFCKHQFLAPVKFSESESEIYQLDRFINKTYLSGDEAINNMNEHFLDTSSILLQNFLREDVYAEIVREASHAKFKNTERANRFNYELVAEYGLDAPVLKKVQQFLASSIFYDFLDKLTGLALKKCGGSLTRFQRTNYTLLTDDDETSNLDLLDCTFFFLPSDVPKWEESWGGTTEYVADDGEVLLQVVPTGNSMSIVFREQGTRKFVKYININSENHSFYMYDMIYRE